MDQVSHQRRLGGQVEWQLPDPKQEQNARGYARKFRKLSHLARVFACLISRLLG